jgi:hypothetical protein
MAESLRVTVTIKPSTGDKFDTTVDEGLTVLQLKESLSFRVSIQALDIRLVFAGKVLKNEDSVKSYGMWG